MNAIIIEDTAVHLDHLLKLLDESPQEIEVIGVARSVKQAKSLISQNQADLIFLDVEIQGGTAFDLLESLGEISTPIIFTTAREEYALAAFRWAAIDYLLKPLDAKLLEEALARLDRSGATQESRLELMKGFLTNKRDRIALHTQEQVHIVKIEQIVRCEADGNYSLIHLQDKKKILVTKTLKEYDTMLQDQDFLRVHQSHLVNMLQVNSFVKMDGGYLLMQDGSKVPVSTRRKTLVMEYLSR